MSVIANLSCITEKFSEERNSFQPMQEIVVSTWCKIQFKLSKFVYRMEQTLFDKDGSKSVSSYVFLNSDTNLYVKAVLTGILFKY